ncbi:arsenate reductase [Neisseria animalis]|uniref:Arsenate reductase n=1 Tax=Neisseria animalis TaxID=492 RepID=A0A5P3MSW4_NEIAN|nr:arsenate reductase [Neisseria animalis]QEY24618.1 arsenate reductase [Neisseria animalis]ROW32970.1 arsenate reductase [Neisseria animalis]VEE07487.1 ArsC family protein [Neisseria animalis]
MIKLYGIPNCDTVKKARTWLVDNGIDYEFVDFKKHAPDEALLTAWLQQVSLEILLNKRGTTWRKLSEAEQQEAQTQQGAIRLLAANPSMIKRPVLEKDGSVRVGFSAENYQNVFK